MALDRYGVIWESHRFTGEELPRLQDVLRSCDRDALIRTMYDTHISSFISPEDVQARSMMEASVSLSLAALCEMELEDGPCQLVFVPKASYILNTRRLTFLRFVDAALIPVEGLPSIAQYRLAVGGRVSTFSQAERLLGEASRSLRQAGSDCSPEGIPFALHSADDLLSYRVWIPSGWCTYERYVFLAAIVWEHLFSGVDSLVGFLSQQAMGALPSSNASVEESGDAAQLHVTYRRKMAEIAGALNHNAFLDCLDDQIELGSRLGLIA